MRFFGIDFSGAADAGRRIWIAELVADGDAHRIVSCDPAYELPGEPHGRGEVHAALVAYIAGAGGGGRGSGTGVKRRSRTAAVGEATFALDFPFSLPMQLLDAESWTDFALQFAGRFPSAAAFQRDCVRLANGRELRRDTDRAVKTPWCAYNLRLYRQTYYGIRDVLAPLVTADAARVCPMQPPAPDKPILLEICPASALKQLGIYRSHGGYKTGAGAAKRAGLFDTVAAHFRLDIDPSLRERIIANLGGDALDSVIAAAVAADVTRRGLSFHAVDRTQALEGVVYV